MPRSRPQPLTNTALGRPNSTEYTLTPRTPHSRSGRAEEGLTEIELQAIRETDDDYRSVGEQQAEPLLASSASDSFPPSGFRNQGDDYTGAKHKAWSGLTPSVMLSRLPLVLGSMVAFLLLVLTVVSYQKPDVLEKYVGSKVTPSPTPVGTPSKPDEDLNYTTFPLLPSQYAIECGKLNSGYMAHGDYWEPHDMGTLDVVHHDDMTNYHLPEGEMTTVCKSTITYMLGGDVGLLADLALMAQAAALARERNRTFLVDDTYWNRGKWTDHFQDVRSRQPGPDLGVEPLPQKNWWLAPDSLGKHWVINSGTAKYHFGHAFSNHYEDPYSHQLNRFIPIYDYALKSFTETIRPNSQNARLIRSARTELANIMAKLNPDRNESEDLPYIATHIRYGDRKPISFNYHGAYIPIPEYVRAVQDTWARLRQNSTLKPVTYVASDSPTALSEFMLSFFANETFSLSQSGDPNLRALASKEEYFQHNFSMLDDQTRITATRGMVIDFALMSGMWAWDGEIIPDAIVCAMGANACKMAAVGLGWERAFGKVDKMGNIDNENKRWVEIDQKGHIVPVWRPFELF
ncbi:hypothetical protein BD779DRAFT_1666971 [Infundibulicybe gibba]|nr:hypothetical protein BD779DRAFT_1666971 [Infundibulicybe gibba]